MKKQLPLPIRVVIAIGASVIWLVGWTLSFVGDKKERAMASRVRREVPIPLVQVQKRRSKA